MTHAPDVTIVIPTRDRIHLLPQSIDSVREQTFESLEVIVVDDASSDGTGEWLAALPPPFRAIRLAAHSERSHARNRGLAEARGDFVMFLDDDDRLRPTAISDLVRGLGRYPNACAAVGAFVLFDEVGNRVRVAHPRRLMTHEAWEDLVFGWNLSPSRVLVRAAAIRVAGGFREDLSFAEDRELALRLTRHAPVVLVPRVVVDYRLHSGQHQPADGVERVEAVIEGHQFGLEPTERIVFAKVRTARELQQAGVRALDVLDHRRAVRLFASAIRARPTLVRSPLTRPALVRPLLKSIVFTLVGRRIVRTARRLVASARRRMRRDVWRSRAPLGDRQTEV